MSGTDAESLELSRGSRRTPMDARWIAPSTDLPSRTMSSTGLTLPACSRTLETSTRSPISEHGAPTSIRANSMAAYWCSRETPPPPVAYALAPASDMLKAYGTVRTTIDSQPPRLISAGDATVRALATGRDVGVPPHSGQITVDLEFVPHPLMPLVAWTGRCERWQPPGPFVCDVSRAAKSRSPLSRLCDVGRRVSGCRPRHGEGGDMIFGRTAQGAASLAELTSPLRLLVMVRMEP